MKITRTSGTFFSVIGAYLYVIQFQTESYYSLKRHDQDIIIKKQYFYFRLLIWSYDDFSLILSLFNSLQ